jgi:small subunit ribosomal protein S8
MTDPIADMLTRIRNAQLVHKPDVTLPYSKLKNQLAEILKSEGYIAAVETVEEERRQFLHLELKYVSRQPMIREIKRISSPGQRVYVPAKRLPYVFDNMGIAIISTSKGLMTNKQARAQKIGGEVICEVF